MNECVDEQKRVDMSQLGANKKSAINATECVDAIRRRWDQKHWYHRDRRDTIQCIDANRSIGTIETVAIPSNTSMRAGALVPLRPQRYHQTHRCKPKHRYHRDRCGTSKRIDASDKSRVPVRAKASIQSNRDLCGVNECVDGSERRCERACGRYNRIRCGADKRVAANNNAIDHRC